METNIDLEKLLISLDGKGYGSYKNIKGTYQYRNFIVHIDKVQADPFAAPSSISIELKRTVAKIPNNLLDSKLKRIAVTDFLIRSFHQAIKKQNNNLFGSGKSGSIIIDCGKQEIIERTAIIVTEDVIIVRLHIGLPASGRRILGRNAAKLFIKLLPNLVNDSLIYKNLAQDKLSAQVLLMIDQEYIRKELIKKGLVAFIGNGSILPRNNGISDKPLLSGEPFKSPASLEVMISLPSGRSIRGMGIKKGITLIVGGGYHGKSTVLQAIQRGVYNHISGDGREYVITESDAVKIRSEDGRSVEKVNISLFINKLPNNKDTKKFSTENASGSTSQATNVMEALESGSKLLLIDEDTSATNFMIRDARMQRLVTQDQEPITPFVDRIQQLAQQDGVSTILIMGGSGDYFDVADRVIMMNQYLPIDVTDRAKIISKELPNYRTNNLNNKISIVQSRIPLRSSFTLSGRQDNFKAKGEHSIIYGKEVVDLSLLEQLVDSSQNTGIAVLLKYFKEHLLNERMTIKEIADKLYDLISKSSLDKFTSSVGIKGDLALPRKQEFMGAINRYRNLKIK